VVVVDVDVVDVVVRAAELSSSSPHATSGAEPRTTITSRADERCHHRIDRP
jgi:hypothetical protein